MSPVPVNPILPPDPRWVDEKQVQLDVHLVCTWAGLALARVPAFIVPHDVRDAMARSLTLAHAIADDDTARQNLVELVNSTTGASAPTP
jgi:hypothetical protein